MRGGDALTTKEKILEEALTLFAQNGYNGTSVEQIAEQIGITAAKKLDKD